MTNFTQQLPFLKDTMEDRYGSILAPYATKYAREGSREFEEESREDENRSDFQRDRDRIIHSKAFRRLMYKTQVFVNHESDHFRTRLTHSLEVAQIARGISKSLGVNEELAEAIALGHDLGHTPFGHAVEKLLSKKLEENEAGHFFHNEQSVRIVDFLEKRCEEYRGLNLTYEVREGILKHNGSSDRSGIYTNLNPDKVCSTLEGQIVNKVDTIAYICHDLQDGIESGLVEQAMHKNKTFHMKMNELRQIIAEILECEIEDIDFTKYSETYFIKNLIHKFIMEITNHSVNNLILYQINSSQDVKEKANDNIAIIEFDEKTKDIFKSMKSIVYEYIYGLNTIQAMDEKAVFVIQDLIQKFEGKPQLLPPEWYYRYLNIENDPAYLGAKNCKMRVICDYISTMTDRYALDEHEILYNPRIKI
jgi:dGTPase